MTKTRIVVVEDEMIVAQDIQRTLTRLGYEVTALAASGAEAIEAVKPQTDLVLMDIQLRGEMDGEYTDGIAAAEHIQSQYAIPVLYLTAHSDEATLRRAKITEPYGYVLKPFDERELYIAIEIALYRHAAETKLRRVERWLAATLKSIGDAVIATDLQGHISLMNPVAEVLTGWKQSEVLGRDLMEVFTAIDAATRAPIESRIAQVLSEGMIIRLNSQTLLVARDGTELPIDDSAAPIRDDDGNIVGIVVIFRDVTRRVQVEEQLRYYALHDVLTGLPNRTVMMDHLTSALERAKRHPDYQFSVLLLDLDRFKMINDSLGHLAGDQVLIELAGRLKTCVRAEDTLARFGGDEFVILLNATTDASDAVRVSNRIHQVLTAPFTVRVGEYAGVGEATGGQEVFTATSIGIVVSTPDYAEPGDVLRDADAALYRAKALGKGRYVMFDAEMHERVAALLRLETDLRRAVERQEFRVYYQPIVSLAMGSRWSTTLRNTTSLPHGFEALIRWQHPERGLLEPAEFLPLAEETGLLIPIGQWLLREACQQVQAWQARFQADPPLTISINLSAREFLHPNLVEYIAQTLQETGLEAKRLCLEITEGIITEGKSAAKVLERLRALGTQLYIDDFGTGYSSLDVLQRVPIHTLKIDRAFVRPLQAPGEHGGERGGERNTIARAIVLLAREFGFAVIAEGVESPEQAAQLQSLGCDYGQGYWFGKAMAEAAMTDLLESQHNPL